MLFGFSFSVYHAEVCVIEGKFFLVITSGGTAVRMMRKGCQAVVDFPPLKEKKLHTQQFLGCAIIGYVDTYQPNTGMRPKCWGSGKMPGAPKASWDQPPLPGV